MAGREVRFAAPTVRDQPPHPASLGRVSRLHGLSASSSILRRWPLAVVSLLIFLQGTYGNQVTQYEPVHIPEENEFSASFLLINDDSGAIYDSYDCCLLQGLASNLFALLQNQSNYADKAELINAWRAPNIRCPPGEVSGGWEETLDSTGKLTLTHGPFGFDTWYAEQQDPDQNEMYINFGIPDSQRDGNGDGWFEWDTNDYTVVLSDPESSAMGVAHDDSGALIYASGHEYELKRNGSIVRLLEVSLKRTNTELYVSLQISCDSTLVTTNYLEKRVLGSNSVWQELRSWVGQEGTTNITDELTNGSSGAQYRMRSGW